jgi:hypothetical protein
MKVAADTGNGHIRDREWIMKDPVFGKMGGNGDLGIFEIQKLTVSNHSRLKKNNAIGTGSRRLTQFSPPDITDDIQICI